MLVVLSGVPGVGKSAIAELIGRRLGAPVLSVDPIEAAIWRCGVPKSFETGVAAYEVAATLAEHQLRLGLTVVVDAVNSLEVARVGWRVAAGRAGAVMRVIKVTCSDTDLHRERLGKRKRNISGFPEPTWGAVLARLDEWEEWPEEHLVLDTAEPLERSGDAALAYLLV